MPNFIASGTVNVTAGQTLVTFEDVLLTEARDGDTLELYGANKGRYTLASIGADLVSAQLSVPFDGVTQTDAPYTVRYDSLQRVPPLELADQLRRMRDQIRIFERTAPLYRVQSLGANTPPGAPTAGDMYVVGTVPTGAWAGQAGNLAQWTGTVWQFTTAEAGWLAYSVAAGKVYFRGAAAWIPYVGPSSFIETLMDDANTSAALSTLGVSDYAKTLLDDTDAAAARATLGGTAFQALGALAGGVNGCFPRFTGPGPADVAMQGIVGTVPYNGLGATPTGAIAGYGAVAGSGNFYKLAGGMLIQRSGLIQMSFVSANRLIGDWTFPTPFPGTYSLSIIQNGWGNFTTAQMGAGMQVWEDIIAGTSVRFSLMGAGVWTAGATVGIRAVAIGEG